MSYEFLAGYQIPTVQQTNSSGTETPTAPNTHVEQTQINTDNGTSPQYSNVNRFIPAGLQGANYLSPLKPLKRKLESTADSTDRSSANVSVDGDVVMFRGRDPSYPEELNKLIHPVYCELCETRCNSLSNAKEHYKSKTHDHNITSWLKRNYTDKGQNPPAVKRFLVSGPCGPDAFHCTLCDLKLMSVAHAKQHYAGRKHHLVANKISQPSGSGYYNAEGNWVRTGTKYTPVAANNGRFGIGEQFKEPPVSSEKATPVDREKAIESKIESAGAATNGPTSLYCQVCKVQATSEHQMTMHMQGAKHKKKMKSSIETFSLGPETTGMGIVVPENGTILNSINEKTNPNIDLSMYRTPSGLYYCKTCNLSLGHVTALQQHLKGKKHLKKLSEHNDKTKVSVTDIHS